MPSIASLGYVGYLTFTAASTFRVRATSCDIKMTQNIARQDVIDGKIDSTVYKLERQEVGGSATFPGVHEDAGDSSMANLWTWAMQRLPNGLMATTPDIMAKYANAISYKYPGCIIDTYDWSVTQSDLVNVTVGVIGADRVNGINDPTIYNYRNSRVVTWNDAIVEVYNDYPGGNAVVTGSEVRSFKVTVANNTDRYYTLNRKMTPNAQGIAPKKRTIDGNIVIMGRNPDLKAQAESNVNRCNEVWSVRWGYELNTGGLCVGSFIVRIPGVVFQIEEITMTNDLLETTVNWHALPGAPYGSETSMTTFVE
jgi:hypothetical protein